MGTYELDIPRLESSAENLSKYVQEVANNISSLKYIIKYIEANWENNEGQDIESLKTNFSTCINELETKIQPTLQQLAKTLYKLAADSKLNQSQTMRY